jgi:hypothetical protein
MTYLQLYHLSKCGGTTIMFLLTKGGVLSDIGKKKWLGQYENRGDPKYLGNKPKNIFIIGTVRNPFEYYVSFWKMICICIGKSDPFTYWGEGTASLDEIKKKSNINFDEVYSPENSTISFCFNRWLYLVLEVLGGVTCHKNPRPKSISNVYKKMMLDKNNNEIYDAMVRLDNFYPSLRKALEKYEKLVPNSINWENFNKYANINKICNKRKKDIDNYYQYYSKDSIKLVKLHDDFILKKYNYSFQY